MIHVLSSGCIYYLLLIHYNFPCQQVGVGRGFGVRMYLFKPGRLEVANGKYFLYFFLASAKCFLRLNLTLFFSPIFKCLTLEY